MRGGRGRDSRWCAGNSQGDGAYVSAKEETPARGLPTNWVVAAGRVGCGRVPRGRVLWQDQILQAGIESKGSAPNASAPQALSCAITTTTAASVGSGTGSRGAFSRH